MPDTFSSLRANSVDSRFRRADLHIHSFGPSGSGDVKDSTMTPSAIVTAAESLGLTVISITDHNRIGNVAPAIEAAKGRNVMVVPGVELSTPGGHILVYADSVDALERIYGRLSFNDTRDACQTSVAEVLSAVEQYGGLAIAAHLDRTTGLESAIQGYGDAKAAVIRSPVLAALELYDLAASSWYTSADTNGARRDLLKARLDYFSNPLIRSLPKVQFSDAHSLSALGKNAADRKKLTRLKMPTLTWESFRAAFADPEARIRLEEEIPTRVPRFVGMSVSGGFLNGQVFSFSPNLTCIIGGRGSGKSTAFQILRAAAGRPDTSGLRSSEAWPEHVDILYADEQNNEYKIEVASEDDPFAFPSDVPIAIDCFEQGEMARTIERYGRDPGALLAFLDELIDLAEEREAARIARDRLADNGSRIERLEISTKQYDDVSKTLEFKKRQQADAKAANSEQLITMQSQLARTAALRQNLLPTFQRLGGELVATFALGDSLADLEEQSQTAATLAQAGEENPFPAIIAAIRSAFKVGHDTVEETMRKAIPAIKAFVVSCEQRQAQLQKTIDEEVAKLRAKGIQLDIKFLSTLAREVTTFEQQLQKLEREKRELLQLRASRKQLRSDYRQAKGRIFAKRLALAKTLTAKLQHFLVDWDVSLGFKEACLSPSAETALKEIMDWRTAAVPKAPALIQSLGLTDFLGAIEKREPGCLQVTGKDGQPLVSLAEANSIISHLSDWARRRRLEESDYEDLPRLVVSRQGEGADKRRIVRSFGSLSLGQQQSIVLAILLSIDNSRPLLIDQPEDNLDSAFVFQILVRALRNIKEHRQVILVTHNANIAVLSDTDHVIPLKATATNGHIQSPGTVEQEATRDLICEILEGGRAAYEMRGKLYGGRR
jgi:DNA repair ATPase RecN